MFGKKLNVPKNILNKVYNCTLSFNDYIKYELDDKIPISCIKESERKIVERLGIDKCKELDWELINNILNKYIVINIDINDILMSIDSNAEEINKALYELVKDKINPNEYTSRMKEVYSDRLFEISNGDNDIFGSLKSDFNRGGVSLKDLIKNWKFFKDKDLSYCLLKDEKNKDNITDKFLKEFMSNYGNIARTIMDNNDIYTVIKTISNLSTEEEKNEYIKQITDDILDQEIAKTKNRHYYSELTNKEYAEIFKYSSLEDFLVRIKGYYSPKELIEEVQKLSIDYIANMSIPFSELLNPDVLSFIEIYGLKNIVDFDNECGHFFTKNNCEMLELMNEMYLHYGNGLFKTNKLYDENGKFINRPYTKDEFYEAMKRMIIKGPTNSYYTDKAPDYREMTREFREKNKDLFISEDAPEELQKLFYTKSLTPHSIAKIIETTPDCIKYLKDKDLGSCFKRRGITTKNKEKGTISYRNFYEFLSSKTDLNNLIGFITEYSDALDLIFESSAQLYGVPLINELNINEESDFEYIKNQFNNIIKSTKFKCVLAFLKINDDIYKIIFKEYIKELGNKIDIEKIDCISEVISRLVYSNSIELSSFGSQIFAQLMNTEDPLDTLTKLEKVFLKNNLPLCGKMFQCFQILYPKLSEVQKFQGGSKRFDFDNSSRIAPSLKDESLPNVGFHASNDEKRMIIIFNDLLRVSYRSNERSLVEYINNIDKGNSLYLHLKENNFDTSQLTNEEKKELEIFVSHLEVLYENTQKGNKEKIDISNLLLGDKLRILSEKFKETKNYDLRDRIVRSFCYMAGISSFDELKSLVESSKKEQQKRIDKFIEELKDNNGIFKLQEGDFIRGIGFLEALSGSLGTGNFCKEQLGSFRGESNSDTTPLDVDLTLITKTDSIYSAIEGTPTGFRFGNIYVVMKKDNPNLYISRDKEGKITGEPYNPKKIEVFGSSVEGNGYVTHWGARTGISLADVDCIIHKKKAIIDSNKPYNEDGSVNYVKDSKEVRDDLPAIKFEIAKNGYYIPIVDFSGKLIFTKDEFNKLREKMQGLSYYGENNYKLSNDLITPEIEQIAQNLNEESVNYTTSKRNKINNIIKEVLDELGLDIKTQMDGDLSAKSVEFIDTGSTGRNTNVPYDGDFDFYMRLDAEIMRIQSTLESFKNLLIKKMEQYGMKNYIMTDKGDLRFKKVQIDEETTVDIDISFGVKTNKIRYSTDECLKDRLKTIKELYPDKYKYVVANIILAKSILKRDDVNAYKPSRTDINQGGLGGVGIENWILQNGGSFIEACKSFKEAALDENGELVSFDEFKQKYEIWDFGENHFSERNNSYLHDNFVADNMNKIGYKKMATAILEYLKAAERNQYQTTSINR